MGQVALKHNIYKIETQHNITQQILLAKYYLEYLGSSSGTEAGAGATSGRSGEVGARGLRTAGSTVGGGTVGTETVCGRRRRGLRRSWRCPCCPPTRARGSLASRC